ncbi:MAG: hypothetical protein L0229_16705 [Blastocatellia bacterium]|nr:hypothetical protein [Blastocatellia bacterium]
MAKKSKDSSEGEPPCQEMSAHEIRLRILELLSENDLTGDQLQKIMLAVEKIVSRPEE